MMEHADIIFFGFGVELELPQIDLIHRLLLGIFFVAICGTFRVSKNSQTTSLILLLLGV